GVERLVDPSRARQRLRQQGEIPGSEQQQRRGFVAGKTLPNPRETLLHLLLVDEAPSPEDRSRWAEPPEPVLRGQSAQLGRMLSHTAELVTTRLNNRRKHQHVAEGERVTELARAAHRVPGAVTCLVRKAEAPEGDRRQDLRGHRRIVQRRDLAGL